MENDYQQWEAQHRAPVMVHDTPENCHECYSSAITVDWNLGQMVCTNCGVVVSETVYDFQNEKRVFQGDDANEKVRSDNVYNPLFEYAEKTSVAGAAKKDRAILNASRRMEKKDGEKKMLDDASTLYHICDIGSVNGVLRNAAIELYKAYTDMISQRRTKGVGKTRKVGISQKDRKCTLAAAIFLACRNHNAPRTYQEMSVLTGVPKKEVGAMVRKMEMALKTARRSEVRSNETYISRFINRLGIAPEMYHVIVSKMNYTESLMEHKKVLPQTLAALAIFATCLSDESLKHISIDDVQVVTGVTKQTILKYHELFP